MAIEYTLIENKIEYKISKTDYNGGSGINYYLNSKWHRENGPAFINLNGYKIWAKNSSTHNENGPAFINGDFKLYCLNGIDYPDIQSDEEWLKFQEELMIKDIIE